VNQINPGWVLTENEARRKREHGLRDDWYTDLPKVFAPAGRILWPEEIAAAAVYWLADECGPISGQVVDLEQHPFIGRNPPKDRRPFRSNKGFHGRFLPAAAPVSAPESGIAPSKRGTFLRQKVSDGA